MTRRRPVALGVIVVTCSLGACGAVSRSHPSTSALPGVGRIDGTVSAGPTCPVERLGHPCAPRPVSALIDATTTNGDTVATTTSGRDGSYTLVLPPGRYTVIVTGVFPRCPPASVTIAAGGTTIASIVCDTGIR